MKQNEKPIYQLGKSCSGKERQPLRRRKFIGTAVLLAVAVAAGVVAPALMPRAAAQSMLEVPTLACIGSTQGSMTVQVCAGNTTGAPAGFSLQWKTAADYAANGWVDGDSYCAASFSGVPPNSPYHLNSGECVDVNINGLPIVGIVGASSDCALGILCGTEYVFRVFAHANTNWNRSEFSPNFVCSTLSCGQGENCTRSVGYWTTHGPIPRGNNSNEWPVTSLTLGNISYYDLQLLAILNTPPAGNGLIGLAHQLIAAKLNIANGADNTVAQGLIAGADALINSLVIPPIGSGSLRPAATSALTSALTGYNIGLIGPGHCDDE